MSIRAAKCLPLLIVFALSGCKPEHNANWYYYWEKDDVIPGLDRTGSPVSRWDWSAAYDYYGAAHGPSDGYVLMDLCIDSPRAFPYNVTHRNNPALQFRIGATTSYGVEQAAATTYHEKRHIELYQDLQQPGASDTDGDDLADSAEAVGPYFFDVGLTDTYDLENVISATYATYADNEFLARQAENAGVAAAKLDEDWSVGGAQWAR
jgi:hypothetical protein